MSSLWTDTCSEDIATSRMGGMKANAVSSSRILTIGLQLHLRSPFNTFILLFARRRMASQATRLRRSQRFGFKPDARGLLVGRAFHLFLNALEPHLRFFLMAGAAVSIGQPDHKLAARMRPKIGQVRGLQVVRLLEVRQAFLNQRTRHLRTRHVTRCGQQHGAARDAYTQIVGRQFHRLVHFLQPALPQFPALLLVALLESLTGFVE